MRRGPFEGMALIWEAKEIVGTQPRAPILLKIGGVVASKNKILLADSDESLEKLENLIKFNDDLIHIVRSKNIAEIVAAVLSFSPERNLNENILSMNDSVASCNATLINLDSVEENIKLERIFSKMDKNLILLETDSPYLAPVPNRGKKNEPAFTADTAKVGAEIFQLSEYDFRRLTTENFYNLFEKVGKL